MDDRFIARILLIGRNLAKFAISASVVAAMCCSHALRTERRRFHSGHRDRSHGRVIPGASIHVVNQATNAAIDTKTNKVGFYQVPGLNTGPYVLTITAAGMETYTRNLDLQVSQTFVADASLTAGAVTTNVTVVGEYRSTANHRQRRHHGDAGKCQDQRVADERAQHHQPGERDHARTRVRAPNPVPAPTARRARHWNTRLTAPL